MELFIVMNPASTVFTTHKNFNGLTIGNPIGDLVKANNGVLYGIARGSAGLSFAGLFRYNPSNNDFQVMFTGDTLDFYEPSPLMLANDGMLYGTIDKGIFSV